MRERKNEEKNNKKWLSITGFLISIFLLLIAIVLSANEEKATREAKINRNVTIVEQTSSEFSRTVNEIREEIKNNTNVNTNATGDSENVIQNQVFTNESNEDNENTNNNQVTENNSNNNSNTNKENNDEDELNPNAKDTSNKNATGENQAQDQFMKPVDGENITSYSMDSLTYSNTLQEWITHRGIDIKADKTTVVKASASGTVKYIKEDPRYGLSITIDHKNGFQTVYSSLLSTEFVKEGDEVQQGQSIGTVGNSAVFETLDGSHLHFEILKDGEYVNPDIYIK